MYRDDATNDKAIGARLAARLTARQLAETLYATARGLKHGSSSEGFTRAMTVAVRAMCAPLKQGSET